jgi:hypothetical protein
MSDVQTVAEAIKTQLQNVIIPGTGEQMRALSYLSDNFAAPCCLVGVNEIEPHTAFGRVSAYEFVIFLVLPRGNDRGMIEAMELYMSNDGTASIMQAVEALDGNGDTLGGVASAARVTKIGPPTAISINGSPYISCPFYLACIAGS